MTEPKPKHCIFCNERSEEIFPCPVCEKTWPAGMTAIVDENNRWMMLPTTYCQNVIRDLANMKTEDPRIQLTEVDLVQYVKDWAAMRKQEFLERGRAQLDQPRD